MNDAERPIAQPKSQRAYWIFQLTGWGLFTLARFVAGVTVLELPWPRLALELLLLTAWDSAFPIGCGISCAAIIGACSRSAS